MRSQSKNRGLTLPEIMISGGILLLLSALFFQGILPALKKEDWLVGKQNRIHAFIAAKEELRSSLRDALLVPLDQHSTLGGPDRLILEYHPENTLPSSQFGEMAQIDAREIKSYNQNQLIQLRFTPLGQLLFTRSDGQAQRLVWHLGPNSDVSANQVQDDQRVDFLFKGQEVLASGASRDWEHRLSVSVR